MMVKKKPRISATILLSKKKEPAVSFVQRGSNNHFLWSFSLLDFDGPFGWSICDCHKKYLSLLKQLKELEQKTKEELGKQGSHSIPLNKLSKCAQNRLREIKLDDCEELYSLRIDGKTRIFCIQRENVMHILWYDPKHLVCPSPKKNT